MTPPAPRELRIATRRSRLALWQAEHVKERLEALHADYGEDRYRPSPFLRRVAAAGGSLLA